MDNVLPLLYQSDYLTIKDYDRFFETYILGIPNEEVKVGLTEHLLPLYTKRSDTVNGELIQDFCRALLREDLNKALTVLRAYLTGIP